MVHICRDESNHDLIDSVRELLMDRVESDNIDDTSYELASSLMTKTMMNVRVVDWMHSLIERPSDDLLRELAVQCFSYKDLEGVTSAVEPLIHSLADVQSDHPIYFYTLEAIYNIDPDNSEAESMLIAILSDDSINDELRDDAALLWGNTEKDEGPLFEYWRKLIDSRPDRHADIGMSILLYGLYDEHDSAAPLMRELADSTENLKVVYKMMSTLDEMGFLTRESLPQLKRLAASDNSRWQAFAEKRMRFFSDL